MADTTQPRQAPDSNEPRNIGLAARMKEIAIERRRFGYRHIDVLLARELDAMTRAYGKPAAAGQTPAWGSPLVLSFGNPSLGNPRLRFQGERPTCF
jgi:hypothetical protein